MNAIVSLSGGMDSATVLADALESERGVQAVMFTYGSKHNPYENAAAIQLARHFQVDVHHFDLSAIMGQFSSNLLKGQGEIPEGHYEAASMSRTVVPGRNTIFASIMLGLAQTLEADEIWIGVHAGDHAIYPDCRPQWVHAMNNVIGIASEYKVSLYAPFISTNKMGIVRRGLKLEVPYQLTRTCYKDQSVACGKCGSCQERLEAFHKAGVEDPIEYESRDLLPKE